MAEEIGAEARKGSFDSNPRLQNWVVCDRCGRPANPTRFIHPPEFARVKVTLKPILG